LDNKTGVLDNLSLFFNPPPPIPRQSASYDAPVMQVVLHWNPEITHTTQTLDEPSFVKLRVIEI
jgi:hypothetical protein